MRAAFFAVLCVGLLSAGCPSSAPVETEEAPPGTGPAAEQAAEPAAAEPAAAEPAAAEPAAEAAPAAAEGSGAAAAPDSLVDGVYTSPRFNVRFTLPEGWSRLDGGSGEPGMAGLGTSDDSITFVGPPNTGLRLVVANSDSIQLVDSSFSDLTETIGFENVRIVPDRTQTRTFNGIPGYRTEADALLRGEPVPQYIIAQALDLPGKPTMFTVFVAGDQYDLHSATMKAILDSIEALDLRPQ